MEYTRVNWEAVGALATAAAAIVALVIALADGWRRGRAHRARGRLAMASLYAPMSGVVTGLQRLQCDSMAFAQALPGTAVENVAENALHLEQQCRLIESLLQTFDVQEAVFLPKDYGAVIAVTVREVSMLVNLVLSATQIYLPLRGLGQYDHMYKAATSQAQGAGLAQSAIENLGPFLIDCQKELGEKDISKFIGTG
jgi:hypothetical protein